MSLTSVFYKIFNSFFVSLSLHKNSSQYSQFVKSLPFSLSYAHRSCLCFIHIRSCLVVYIIEATHYILIRKKALRKELLCIYSMSCSDVRDVINLLYFLLTDLLAHALCKKLRYWEIKKNFIFFSLPSFFGCVEQQQPPTLIAFYRKKIILVFYSSVSSRTLLYADVISVIERDFIIVTYVTWLLVASQHTVTIRVV